MNIPQGEKSDSDSERSPPGGAGWMHQSHGQALKAEKKTERKVMSHPET